MEVVKIVLTVVLRHCNTLILIVLVVVAITVVLKTVHDSHEMTNVPTMILGWSFLQACEILI